jgi:DNA-binding MarR family transcriptional regulator
MRRGGYRWTDPATAVASAMSVNVAAREYDVLCLLAHHRLTHQPINGWEMSRLLGWTTISTVPRIAPLRRKGMIEKIGVRPGPPPAHKTQDAYVITPRGRAFLADVKARKT